MILQTIKDTFSSLLSDVGMVGWLVIGLYVVLFSMRVFLKVISIKRARINRMRRAKLFRARLDFYNSGSAYYRSGLNKRR